jgi:hypothetical protein
MSKIPPPAAKAVVPLESEDRVRRGLRKGATTVETAQFIADFSSELSHLARECDLDLLAYLLDMARLEAMRVFQSRQP